MSQVLSLMVLMLRAYARDRVALFFSLFVPLMLMVIFGYLNLGAFGRVTMAVVDEARNADSARFVEALASSGPLTVRSLPRGEALRQLERSELDMALVLPPDFRIAAPRPGDEIPTVVVYGNQARPQQVAAGQSMVSDVINQLSFAVSQTGPAVRIERESVAGVRLRYVDFLVPGILGLSVMQLAIFSVAFALVVDKQRGVLRRIMATPLDPRRFLAARVLMRLILVAAQVLVLLAVAKVLFDVQVLGGYVSLLVVALLGGVVFLTQGYAIAGWARTENQVPAIANVITLPQFFLSGVFFSKEAAPAVIRPLTDLLPLTFLNDALREISVQGASLWDVRGDLLGLAVWGALGFALAVRLFRFEQN